MAFPPRAVESATKDTSCRWMSTKAECVDIHGKLRRKPEDEEIVFLVDLSLIRGNSYSP